MLDYTTIALAGLALILLVVLIVLVTRRKAAAPEAQLRKISPAYLAHFLIPDGQGGEIHIEHALLCARGIVIIDVKDVEGNIFGSDAMEDWTVLTGKKRFTFANPQSGLYDRTAAVSALITDVPVSGVVAFSSRGKFTKGQPNNVANLDHLVRELTAEMKDQRETVSAWLPAWDKLRDAAIVAQMDRLIDD